MMLKKIVFAVIVFIFQSTYSQISEGRVVYQASVNKEILLKMIEDKKKEIPDNFEKIMREQILNATDVQLLLLFNESESLFYSESEHNLKNESRQEMNMTSIDAGTYKTYYSNIVMKEKFFQNLYFNKLLIALDPPQWKMSQETKRIGKYTCFKATTSIQEEGINGVMTRIIIAWYTPQIPAAFGVQNFHGLPGLTLELNIDKKIFFKAIKIELNPEEKVVITKPKGKVITEKEMNEMFKNLRR